MDNGANGTGAKNFGVGAFFLGMLAGALIGGVAALLLAPKSGAETREMFTTQFNKIRDAMRSKEESGQEPSERQPG